MAALKCYFCYGTDESGDCILPEDESGNRLVESTSTMKFTSCLSTDDNCYKINYSCKWINNCGSLCILWFSKGLFSVRFQLVGSLPPEEVVAMTHSVIAIGVDRAN